MTTSLQKSKLPQTNKELLLISSKFFATRSNSGFKIDLILCAYKWCNCNCKKGSNLMKKANHFNAKNKRIKLGFNLIFLANWGRPKCRQKLSNNCIYFSSCPFKKKYQRAHFVSEKIIFRFLLKLAKSINHKTKLNCHEKKQNHKPYMCCGWWLEAIYSMLVQLSYDYWWL